jgi:hypothetical protein
VIDLTKVEAYIECRRRGMTYQAIADLYGISKQAVHEAIQGRKNRSIHVKPQSVVFPGLRKWMCENHVFIKDLETKTGLRLRSALSSGRINNAKVNAILEVTELTYEEAFGK